MQSEKLILQLISTRIPSDYVDIALIWKCITIHLPALQSASKTCEKSLLKYLSFPGVKFLIVIEFILYWIVLNLGLCILFRRTLVLRCTLSRDHLEILLMLVFSLIMLIKQSLNFLKPLNWDILIGEILVSAPVSCLSICLII